MAPYWPTRRRKELHRAISQVARVFRIERDWIGAAKFVTEFLVDNGDFQTQRLEFLVECVFHHAAEVDVAEPEMTVIIAADIAVAPSCSSFSIGASPFSPSASINPSASTATP